MTSLAVKILKDEDGNNFVPYTSTIALYDPDGETISDKIAKKLETSSLIAGTGITLIPDITNHTVEIQSSAPGANLINNLTTSVAGQGALDAYQGYILNTTKQDTLVSGQNIKTINGSSVLGSGNLTIDTGTNNYNNLSNKPSINGVVLEGNKTSEDLGINILTDNQVLWGPNYFYMNASQTISLSQKVSEQKNGIILVWQAYTNGEPQYYDFNYTFVPKHHILIHNGAGVTCWLSNSTGNIVATKYVYVHDNQIEGNAVNDTGNTNRSGSGIITNSKYWVLTYVLGV